ncbi:MAG: cytochrome c, partial [Bacteroidia bacterium]|nr:cytochrome c [Bacteroidia bacterium]
LYPPLAGSDYLLKNREASIRAVKFGQQGPIVVNGTTYNAVMAPLGLENDEVADVMNYILYSWGNKADKPVSEEEVAAVEK